MDGVILSPEAWKLLLAPDPISLQELFHGYGASVAEHLAWSRARDEQTTQLAGRVIKAARFDPDDRLLLRLSDGRTVAVEFDCHEDALVLVDVTDEQAVANEIVDQLDGCARAGKLAAVTVQLFDGSHVMWPTGEPADVVVDP